MQNGVLDATDEDRDPVNGNLDNNWSTQGGCGWRVAGSNPPLIVISFGNTHEYSARQFPLLSQVFMHHVSAVRLGMKRHSTHAPSGQVSGSHEKTVQ